MNEGELIEFINTQTSTELYGNLVEKVAEIINNLIQNDFNKLLNILYAIDVDENKLKKLLQQSKNEDAAVIIARLVIERQREKAKTRKQFKS